MTLIGDDDHKEAVRLVAKELAKHGLRLMALGSTALLLRTGRHGSTKDVDLHPFPVQDFVEYYDTTQEVAKALGGNAILEKDGASVTLNINVAGKTVTVELIEGTDEWISPEILADAVKTGTKIGDVLVPSWEHIVAMKAEAYYDRVGLQKQKYLGDLTVIKDRLVEAGTNLRRIELERIVRMRHERKHDDMLATSFRIYAQLIH